MIVLISECVSHTLSLSQNWALLVNLNPSKNILLRSYTHRLRFFSVQTKNFTYAMQPDELDDLNEDEDEHRKSSTAHTLTLCT